VNAKTKQGGTALILASQNGHLEVVKTLLAANADINAKGFNGLTALAAATGQGHLDVTRVLMESQPPTDGVKLIKTDQIILSMKSDGDDVIITAGWPRLLLETVDNKSCTLNIKFIRDGFVSFEASEHSIKMNGLPSGALLAVAGGVPEGVYAMIGMPNPSIDAEVNIVDAVGCEWRFPEEMSFTFRGIKFVAKPGAKIAFEPKVVRLMGVKISDQ